VENPGIMKEAMNLLVNYSWPGNVRELANTIQKTLIFNRGGPLGSDDFTQTIGGEREGGKPLDDKQYQGMREWICQALISSKEEKVFDSCINRFASIIISEALNMAGGNRSRAAKLLGLSRPTLHSKIEKYRLRFEKRVREE